MRRAERVGMDLRARGCDPRVQQPREGAGRGPCSTTGGGAPGVGGSPARRGRRQHARPATLALRNGGLSGDCVGVGESLDFPFVPLSPLCHSSPDTRIHLNLLNPP